MIPRVVPWRSNQEFKQVFEWLYSDMTIHPDRVQSGIDMVKAWVCRGRIPIAVKSTMDLIELQLREQKQAQSSNPLSQNELRLLYGSALTRFVNITEDSLQTKYYAKSLYSIAGEIGLPLHIVQLRHAATHEDLPSLFMLRQGCVIVLQWLYDSYWSVQMNMDSSEELTDVKSYEISVAISNYKEKRKTVLRSRTNETCQKWLKKVVDLLSPDTLRDTVIASLLAVGGLVPSGKKKRPSLESMTVSEELLQLWLPLLQELDTTFPSFANELITGMVERLDAGSDYVVDPTLFQNEPSSMEPNQKEFEKYRHPSYLLTLTCWLRYFVSQCDTRDKVFESIGIDQILEPCLRSPNTYTRAVLQAIVQTSHENTESIKPFIQYIDQTIASSQQSTDSTTHTILKKRKLNDLDISMEEEIAEVTGEMQVLNKKLGVTKYVEPVDDDDSTQSGWVLHDKNSWAPCPIGCLPAGKVSRLDFFVLDATLAYRH